MDLRTAEPITASQAENSAFIWEVPNPLYFRIIDAWEYNRRNILMFQIRFNHNLRRRLHLHKCFLNFRIWTTSSWLIRSFFQVFCSRINRYLYNIGVIGINNVIRAIQYAVDSLPYVECNEQQHIIKFNLY
ncbi:REn protein [Corchorus yellow vein virus - [Hoa Binh]]|uniref:AC3 n=2 Tax=Corchorus yellow vein virus TaxID=333361 RepID=A0A1B1NXD0_9GEMI|nr:REn protein [Corchorus yellow vein virus - [Hoa Binh]]AAU29406.1 REn protein [Corchorus yellow vein virus - [Hoa Binh]]AND99825.1 AC3 [Corchorus yellow vein Vietnam virus [CN:FZ:2015]]ANS88316.1 AC3 [Corchorus yellow vein virus - [Hoa Binh]]